MTLKFFPNVIVWGDKYIESFLHITVPTLLGAGNLEELSKFPGSEFLIVCPDVEQTLVRKSPEFLELECHVPIKFLPLDWDMAAKSHPIFNMSEGHKRIAAHVGGDDSFAIFLSPDCVLSAGAFCYLIGAATRGVRAISAPGFRLIKERVIPELQRFQKNGRISLTGRDLVAMFHRFAHPEMEGYFTDATAFTRHSHFVLWRIGGGKNFVGRGFHLHPIMVQIPSAANTRTLDDHTIDGDFVGRLVGDFSRIKVVADSDELVIFSISSQSELQPHLIRHAFTPSHVARWAYCRENSAIHRFYFTQPFVIHDSGVDEREVEHLIEQTGRIAHEILSHPEPIQYVGYAHDPPRRFSVGNTSTRDLMRELASRSRPLTFSKLRQAFKLLAPLPAGEEHRLTFRSRSRLTNISGSTALKKSAIKNLPLRIKGKLERIYHLDNKVDELKTKISSQEEQIVALEQKTESGDEELKTKISSLQEQIVALEQKIESGDIYSEHGVLKSTRSMPADFKRNKSLHLQYGGRAYIALIVTGNYPGGDYLEFGSDGMGTFRNFLSAYDLNAVDSRFPDTRFHAFDIFGSVDVSEAPKENQEYFNRWSGENKLAEASNWIKQHGLYLERCQIHAGFFEKTVPVVLKEMEKKKRTIGFAFLDCNISSSYEFLFGQILWSLRRSAFIYLDEYYDNPDVPMLFREFKAKLLKECNVEVEFVTNSGAYGALFKLMGKASDPLPGRETSSVTSR